MEGLVVPSKVYGAMAAGVPIIFVGDPDGEVARIISKAGAGTAVAGVEDGAALSGEILRLLNSEQLHRQLGSASRAAFEQMYERRLAIDRWSEILESA